ncbi:MAG: hypothetical protein OHK0013_41950 [Sandaracinaceae bacterium]
MSDTTGGQPHDELRVLASELAELLRVEHEMGAIGLPSAHPLAPTGVAAAPIAPGRARLEPGAAGARPMMPNRAATPARASTAAPPSEALADVDALLARAKKARTAASPPLSEAPRPLEPRPAPAAAPEAAPRPDIAVGTGARPVEATVRLQVLAELAAEAAACRACRLHESRTRSVFARGNPDAELVFVGEGPGFNEDRQGEPFVGAAGQLLDKMIGAMGLSPKAVYICNVVKCRPPENRTPLPDESAACARFLDGQLGAVGPKVIVALGRCAAERLGCAEVGRSWRGSWGEYRGVPVMPTYHPAYLLRSPEMKRPVWEDLQKVMERLGVRGTR